MARWTRAEYYSDPECKECAELVDLLESRDAEIERLRFKLDWIFDNCKVVFFPESKDSAIPYPYEHNPHANKIMREDIELIADDAFDDEQKHYQKGDA